MWLFLKYGFYSIACATKPDGTLDKDTVMIRSRRDDHLQNVKGRFAALADVAITSLPDRDYRYRLVVPKKVWVPILAELAEEQDWSNFKNEAAAYQGHRGASYSSALHDVWEVMHRLQR